MLCVIHSTQLSKLWEQTWAPLSERSLGALGADCRRSLPRALSTGTEGKLGGKANDTKQRSPLRCAVSGEGSVRCEAALQTSGRHNRLHSLLGGSSFKPLQQQKKSSQMSLDLLGEFPKGGEATTWYFMELDQQVASPCMAIGTAG